MILLLWVLFLAGGFLGFRCFLAAEPGGSWEPPQGRTGTARSAPAPAAESRALPHPSAPPLSRAAPPPPPAQPMARCKHGCRPRPLPVGHAPRRANGPRRLRAGPSARTPRRGGAARCAACVAAPNPGPVRSVRCRRRARFDGVGAHGWAASAPAFWRRRCPYFGRSSCRRPSRPRRVPGRWGGPPLPGQGPRGSRGCRHGARGDSRRFRAVPGAPGAARGGSRRTARGRPAPPGGLSAAPPLPELRSRSAARCRPAAPPRRPWAWRMQMRAGGWGQDGGAGFILFFLPERRDV